jgi:long-chain acyl-CoA synthetase
MFNKASLQPKENLLDLLRFVSEQDYINQPGISFVKGSVIQQQLSYREYIGRVQSWSRHLESIGVKEGQRVGTLLKNRLDVPIIYLAVMSLGAIVVPLNPAYSDREYEFVLNDAGISGVLTDAATFPADSNVFDKCDFLLDIDEVHLIDWFEFPNSNVDRNSPAIMLYTSGTTAFPKGVLQKHGNLVANAWSMVKSFGIDKPTQLSIMPFYHAHAVGFGMMTCLLSGGHLIVAERMDPLNWAKIVSNHNVSITSMVPNLLHILLRTGVTRQKVPSLNWVFVSAAPLPSQLAKEFEDRSGLKIAHAWGLSEYTNFATALPATAEPELRQKLMFGETTPCVGSALDGVSIEIRSPDGRPVRTGDIGELWIKGPSLTLGYFNNPKETSKTIVDGWLKTGDEGYEVIENSTAYYFITDRIKDVVIRSGEKISPMAVEAFIVENLPDLMNNVVALGFEHSIYGEEVGLVIEQSYALDHQESIKSVMMKLPVRMRPKVILYGHEIIPRTHTGKIQRRHLRGLFTNYRDVNAGFTFEMAER